MTEQERLELEAHAEELERVAAEMERKSREERYSHGRKFFSGVASAYEIQAVWLRGFLRRLAEEQTAPTAEEDRAANEGRDASRQARWG